MQLCTLFCLFYDIQIITVVLINTFPAPLGDVCQIIGTVMVMMIVVITQMNKVANSSSVQNVNSDVLMENVSQEAGVVMR